MAESPARSTTDREPLLVDLALQGGGSHGAFTWGALDRLLDEEWLEIEGISGTSAGAMNATVLASGYAQGGRTGAQEALTAFWQRVAWSATLSPLQRTPVDRMLGVWTLDHSPAYITMDLLSRMFSPYELAPWASNPLAGVLAESVDFAATSAGPVKLFITATNVHTGRGRVFRNDELSPDVLMASACLPTMFQAVEIDGEPYWDGGYAGNPTMTPLMRECDSDDTIIVPINPITRPGTPRSAREIMNRLNEVSFNATLLKELKMIALLRQAGDHRTAEGAHWARNRVHYVKNDVMVDLGSSSKLNAEWDFLTMLRDEGRKAADTFLTDHGDDLGKRSTLDIDRLLDGV